MHSTGDLAQPPCKILKDDNLQAAEPKQVQNLRLGDLEKVRFLTEDGMIYERLKMESASNLRDRTIDTAHPAHDAPVDKSL